MTYFYDLLFHRVTQNVKLGLLRDVKSSVHQPSLKSVVNGSTTTWSMRGCVNTMLVGKLT